MRKIAKKLKHFPFEEFRELDMSVAVQLKSSRGHNNNKHNKCVDINPVISLCGDCNNDANNARVS